MSTKLKAGTATSGAVIDADTTGILELQTGSTPTTAITVDTAQNVGIGTSSPAGKLSVYYSANTAYNTGLSVYNVNSGNTATASIQWTNDAGNRAGGYLTSSTCPYYGGTNTFNLGTVESIPFTFLTGNSERMRIDASGNVLIGTTNQLSTSKITSNVSSTTGIGYGVLTPASFTNAAIYSNSVTAAGTGWYHFLGQSNSSSVNNIIIFGNGNIQNANASYGGLSDIKLKENIVDASPKLDKLMDVKVRNYNLINDELKQIGVVAQELESVFPALVEEIADRDEKGNTLETTTKSVKYSVFVPILIKAIQELNAKVEALEAQLGAK